MTLSIGVYPEGPMKRTVTNKPHLAPPAHIQSIQGTTSMIETTGMGRDSWLFNLA